MQERTPQAGSPCIRERIVQAAIRSHRQIGFKKTTVADIARGASMSPANVYRFFASKQAIEEAVAADLFEQVSAAATLADSFDSSCAEANGAFAELKPPTWGVASGATVLWGLCDECRGIGDRVV